MTKNPLIHLHSGPRPSEWVCEEFVVLTPTGVQMRDECVTTWPVAAFEVARTESAKEQLRLIEPRRMCGRHECSDARVVRLKEVVGRRRNVARATVPDDVNPARVAVVMEQLSERGPQIIAVIGIQAPAAHLATVDDQRHKEVDRPVSDVLKLPVLNLTGPHQIGRVRPFQNLQAGHLVQADHQLAISCEIMDVFVAPEHGRRSLPKRCVERV